MTPAARKSNPAGQVVLRLASAPSKWASSRFAPSKCAPRRFACRRSTACRSRGLPWPSAGDAKPPRPSTVRLAWASGARTRNSATWSIGAVAMYWPGRRGGHGACARTCAVRMSRIAPRSLGDPQVPGKVEICPVRTTGRVGPWSQVAAARMWRRTSAPGHNPGHFATLPEPCQPAEGGRRHDTVIPQGLASERLTRAASLHRSVILGDGERGRYPGPRQVVLCRKCDVREQPGGPTLRAEVAGRKAQTPARASRTKRSSRDFAEALGR
jgi:hypothetical protein